MVKLIGLDTETLMYNKVHEFFSFQLFSDDFYYYNKPLRIFSTNSFDFEYFLSKKFKDAWFITFNLAFDGVVIARILKNRGYSVKAVLAGSRMVRMTIRRNKLKWILCDLKNILPLGNLDNVGKVIGFNKMVKPDYLGTREPETETEKTYFKEYAMRDAEICYKASKMVLDEFKTFRTTSAGLAIRVYKRDFCKIRKMPNYINSDIEKMRLSYHGGRTECFIRGVNPETITGYDVNSLYPYVMKFNQFPDITQPFKHKTSLDLENEGIVRAILTIDHNSPPLCIKKLFNDGIEKLTFPCGKIEGWFTYPELRLIENQNIGKILKIHETYEWKQKFNPFNDYVSFYHNKKTEATLNNSPLKAFYKVMLNSLYGKFGEKGGVRFLTFNGEEITDINEGKERKAWYHSVPLASYITAYARLHLFNIIKDIPQNKLYYCDTDSIFTSKDLSNQVGDKLGMLKNEGKAEKNQAMFIRSKFYTFNDKVVMKGFVVKENPTQIKLSIFSNNFKRYEHRILKVLESKRIGKLALTDTYIQKEFTVEPDGKRLFKTPLTPQELIVETSISEPLLMENV